MVSGRSFWQSAAHIPTLPSWPLPKALPSFQLPKTPNQIFQRNVQLTSFAISEASSIQRNVQLTSSLSGVRLAAKNEVLRSLSKALVATQGEFNQKIDRCDLLNEGSAIMFEGIFQSEISMLKLTLQ
ncbi:uncharacterized protein LOC135430106 [Drosophila montana]|uniref:uncharacterized protein LOC135430106 n=1 Tax=Drosophila montana TaxID=40370 RepID=UPI00313D6B08